MTSDFHEDSPANEEQGPAESQPSEVSRRHLLRTALVASGTLLVGGAGGFALGRATAPVYEHPSQVRTLPAPTGSPAPKFPIAASDDDRGLVDAGGASFYYLADTAWNALSRMTDQEFETLAVSRRERGFTALQMSLLDFRPSAKNVNGHAPFTTTGALDQPAVDSGKDDYWSHIDRCLDTCERVGLLACLVPAWYGGYGDAWRGYVTEANAASYATFLARRYGGRSNLWWLLGGDDAPTDEGNAARGVPAGLDRGTRVPQTIALGAGLLAESSVKPLMSYHTARTETVEDDFGTEPWYQLSAAYSGADPIPFVTAEYRRPTIRPVVLWEAYYEARDRDPILDRRALRAQAYHSLLSGAAGYAYGHSLVWQVKQGWQEALDSRGVRDISTLAAVLRTYVDGPLVPVSESDGSARLLPDDYFSPSEAGVSTSAALLPESAGALAYFGEPRESIVVNTTAIQQDAQFEISWIDPATAEQFFVGSGRSGDRLTVNWPSQWQDALLVLTR